MTTDTKVLNRIKTDLQNILYNAQSLRDSPFKNDRERQDSLHELITEISLLYNAMAEYVDLNSFTVLDNVQAKLLAGFLKEGV